MKGVPLRRLAVLMLVLATHLYAAADAKFPMVKMGNVEAKTKAVLFISPSCSHCFEFYRNVLPVLQTTYVAGGALQLTIMPYARGQDDIDTVARMACTPRQFSETLHWYFTNVPWDKPGTAGEIARANQFPLTESGQCKEELALQKIVLDIRGTVDRTWAPKETPILVIGGEAIQHPDTASLRTVRRFVEKHISAK